MFYQPLSRTHQSLRWRKINAEWKRGICYFDLPVTREHLERADALIISDTGTNKLSETFVVVITWYNFTVGETCLALLPI